MECDELHGGRRGAVLHWNRRAAEPHRRTAHSGPRMTADATPFLDQLWQNGLLHLTAIPIQDRLHDRRRRQLGDRCDDRQLLLGRGCRRVRCDRGRCQQAVPERFGPSQEGVAGGNLKIVVPGQARRWLFTFMNSHPTGLRPGNRRDIDMPTAPVRTRRTKARMAQLIGASERELLLSMAESLGARP